MRNNPFKENIQVIDEGYIGRHDEIRYLMNILGRNEKDGGVVISGLTRMGKTSLVKKCFAMAEKEGLLKNNNIITASITVSTVKDFSKFLRRITQELYDTLEDRELLDKTLEKLFAKADSLFHSPNEDLIYEQDHYLKQILRKLNKKGIKAVILLDEFDDAQRAFYYEGEFLSTNFQKFRDYATDADYNCTFILTSRINISQIDGSLPSGSNLRGVFSEKPLVGFTDQEREEFFRTIIECGFPLTPEQKEEFIWFAGRSPLLFSKIACWLLDFDERDADTSISVRELVLQNQSDFIAYFESLIAYMNRDNMFYKFIQVFYGPRYDLSENDTNLLLQYGYIYHDLNDEKFLDSSFIDGSTDLNKGLFTYQTLSMYFVEYVRTRVNQDDSLKLWSELIEAEKKLRKMVKEGLQNKYGKTEWIRMLQKYADTEEKGYLYNVKKATEFIANSKRTFGEVVEEDPLCVININALGNIIKAFWDDCYENLFNPPYTELWILIEELEQLNKARNPLAHGLPSYLSPLDKEKVTKYCKKILHIPQKGKKNLNK